MNQNNLRDCLHCCDIDAGVDVYGCVAAGGVAAGADVFGFK